METQVPTRRSLFLLSDTRALVHKGQPPLGWQTWVLSQSWLGPSVCHVTELDSVLSQIPFRIQEFGMRDQTTNISPQQRSQ